jgi:putative two-component system response regulator
MIGEPTPVDGGYMTEKPSAISLEELVVRLEALSLISDCDDWLSSQGLLPDLARVCREATFGYGAAVDKAADFGERACRSLLGLPVTMSSEALAHALWEVARFNGVRRINLALALELSRRLADVGYLIGSVEWQRKAHLAAANLYGYCGNNAVAVEEAWTAMKLARESGFPIGVAAVWNCMGNALAGAGLHQVATQCFEKAIAIADGVESAEDRKEVLTSVLINLAMLGAYLGDFRRGLDAAEQVRRLRLGDTSARAAAAVTAAGVFHVHLLLETGDVQRARSICDELQEISFRTGSDAYAAQVLSIDGLCRVFENDRARGLADVRKGLEALRRLTDDLRHALRIAIRAHEIAGEAATADMYRRELVLHNRLAQQQGMLQQHRSHLRRLQSEDGLSEVTLERKAEMVERLAITTEMREDPSGLRVFRVGRLSRLLAVQLGWSDPDAEALEVAARLHDIGKISVADDIVTAGRPLTADELQAMRAHCHVGADLLRQTELENARLAADVAAYHHEAWDGSGYPHGIGGTAIPLAARIVAIADAFAAMTGERPYQPRLDVRQALQQLQAGAGSRHDPTLVPRFVEMVEGLLGSVDDLDSFLAEAADRSPFMQVHRQLAQRLAETRH